MTTLTTIKLDGKCALVTGASSGIGEAKGVLALIPSRRIGRAEEVAGAVLYLVSDEAAYVTGTTLLIDGGITLYSSFLGQA